VALGHVVETETETETVGPSFAALGRSCDGRGGDGQAVGGGRVGGVSQLGRLRLRQTVRRALRGSVASTALHVMILANTAVVVAEVSLLAARGSWAVLQRLERSTGPLCACAFMVELGLKSWSTDGR